MHCLPHRHSIKHHLCTINADVDVEDTGHGEGLSPVVAAALPRAIDVVLQVLIEQSQESANQQP